jgi:hypothetical protein
MIHLGIADVVNAANNYEFWMALKNLAAKTLTSERSVNRFMQRAVACGALDVLEDNSRAGKPNRYRFIFPEDTVSHEGGPEAEGSAREASGVRPEGKQVGLGGAPGYDRVAINTESANGRGDPRANNPMLPTTVGAAEDSPAIPSVPATGHRDEAGDTVVADSDVGFVFEAWTAATGREAGRTRLTKARRDLIGARLGEGYDVDTLVAAVRGITKSRWHMGQNDRGMRFDDLKHAIGSAEKVEQFARMYIGEARPMDATDQALAMLREMRSLDDQPRLEAGA